LSLPRTDAYSAVLFDLDGTLVDSLPDIAWSANRMLRELGLPERGLDELRAWIGNGVDRLVKRALTGEMEAEPDSGLFERGLALFKDFYAGHVSELSEVYPGARETLQILDAVDLHIACVTNKAERFTLDLLAALDLERYFSLVVSGDTTPRKKPDPLPLHYAAKHYRLDSNQCLMVGDSENDVAAARAAGFAIACVPYGYNHGVDIRQAKPDLVVDNLRELAEKFA
jgi:phosphoglycolate phosphatase